MSVVNLKTEYRKTAELIPYARNARTHSEQQISQIAASIKEFGFNNPVAVDADGMILCGHGRVLAAQKLKLETVPVVCLSHLTETQKKAYILADNKLALNAGWDNDLLKVELEDLKLSGVDLNLIGFSDIELDKLLEQENEAKDDDYDDPLPLEPKSSAGEIWICGKHKVMCGDSCSIGDVEKLMNGDKADLLITDPPYNVSYEGGTKDHLTIKNDSMEDSSFRQFLRDAFLTADMVMKPGAVFYIWHADVEGYNFRGACRDVNWKVRECLIWKKNALVMGRQDYQWQHEPRLYGWKEGTHLWASDRKQTTILEFAKPQRNDVHPTMKPVPLFDYQIKNNTKEGDLVLDLFGGSGTTMIACEQNGRHARLMELDPKYVDVIVDRWQKLTGKEAVRESDGVKFNSLK